MLRLQLDSEGMKCCQFIFFKINIISKFIENNLTIT